MSAPKDPFILLSWVNMKLRDTYPSLEELCASENPMTFPPNSYMAASKLSLVRVEGSKKRVASFFPRQS